MPVGKAGSCLLVTYYIDYTTGIVIIMQVRTIVGEWSVPSGRVPPPPHRVECPAISGSQYIASCRIGSHLVETHRFASRRASLIIILECK